MTDIKKKTFDELTPDDCKDLKIQFAPGCFDSFEGTQEELDKLNRILRNEQGIRVKYCGERKFKAYNNSGKVVLEKTF